MQAEENSGLQRGMQPKGIFSADTDFNDIHFCQQNAF